MWLEKNISVVYSAHRLMVSNTSDFFNDVKKSHSVGSVHTLNVRMKPGFFVVAFFLNYPNNLSIVYLNVFDNV